MTPAYKRVVDDLRAKIHARELPVGTRLPSLSKLGQMYGVSSDVARQAIAVLRADGRVATHHGAGTFVLPDRAKITRVCGDGPAGLNPEPSRTCPRCGGRLTVCNPDEVTIQLMCLPCFRQGQALVRDPRATPSQVRQRRRTAHGTMAALPLTVYAEVRDSGPCVFCGAPATAVDHVWPLTRGGLDLRENLVPICKPCNSSKQGHLLTEWDAERVARAAAISQIVARELERLRLKPFG